ncbi:putative lysophospholipase A [Rosellinia necatrix]|uniref:Putative lysophospholipase A n=1 Tax=Rosellinia necatrix TaxID=77044 RepID=A0A1S7UJN0_ROSNE|nr:putative lysophospholipase A [Rosellinia necatrix]
MAITGRILLFLCAVGLAWARAGVTYTSKSRFSWDNTKYLIAFGDSYTFVQGTAGYPNYSFIGSYLPGQFGFSPATLLSNKIVQNFTGTAEGGPNWVEYLTGCGLEPGETLPRDCDVQLWNFAFAGADVSLEYLPQHHDYTIPLVNQTQQYLTWAEPVIGKKMDKSKALVAFWIGINDINDSSKFTNVSFPAFYDQLIDAVFAQSVQSMYEAGYKNFLFINLPPLDRTAANVLSVTPRPNKTMIGWWGDSLAAHSMKFAAQNEHAKAMVYDANIFLNGVLDEPWKYGIENTISYCSDYADPDVQEHPVLHGCLPLDRYFWYNAGHM